MIHFLMTGGTIDSVWDAKLDSVVISEHSIIPTYIDKIDFQEEVNFTEVCMKDSRALTEEDLANILKAIEQTQSDKIVVTHGRYTMPDTVKFLSKKLKDLKKTIVLTGATSPIRGSEASDAFFNLGYAVGKVQELKPGIYVCVNGRTLNLEEIDKAVSQGQFYSVFEEKQ